MTPTDHQRPQTADLGRSETDQAIPANEAAEQESPLPETSAHGTSAHGTSAHGTSAHGTSAHGTPAHEASDQKVPDRKPAGMKWGSFIEARIREAQDDGAFENLPGFGKPIPGLGGNDDESWWLKEKARRENLNLLPPALEIRLDVQRTLERIEGLVYEADVRRTLEALNQRIAQAQRAAVWGPPCDTLPLDVEVTLARWRTARAGS